MLNIQLHRACFGLGVTYDRLSVTAERPRGDPISVSPPVILSLIESQLGYVNVFSDSTSWQFKREIVFKR